MRTGAKPSSQRVVSRGHEDPLIRDADSDECLDTEGLWGCGTARDVEAAPSSSVPARADLR
jgi:hypothetical protein